MSRNRFVCEICRKRFLRNRSLQHHREAHNLPWNHKQRSDKDVVKKNVCNCSKTSCGHHAPSMALGGLRGIRKHEKTRTPTEVFTRGVSDNFRSFKSLFPGILSPGGIKLPALKNLYRLLVILSSEAQWTAKKNIDSHDLELEICHHGVQVTFGDICELSNILFKELEERFGQCFSTICDTSTNKGFGGCSSYFGLYDAVKGVNLSLRCCMVLLTLLAVEGNVILEKGYILLKILTKLNSLSLRKKTGNHVFIFEKPAFHESSEADHCPSTSSAEKFLEPHNPLLYFKSTILEVFVDEVLVHGQIRGHLEMINYAASINDKQFFPESAHGNMGIVAEAICNHFILTFSDKQAIGGFLARLFCLHPKEFISPFRVPALGLTAAVSLFFDPMMISAPKYMQTHVVSLVSEATYSVMDITSSERDHKLINCFLSTFEKSVTMFMAHMSCLLLDYYFSHATGSATSKRAHKIASPSFESYVSADMKNKVHNLINELEHFSNLNLHESFSQMRSDLVRSSMRFIKECQSVYDASCQDEITSILSCLILKASESFDDTALRPLGGTTLQDISLLASLLKLMSISLLQAIRCLRHSDDFCCPKILKDFSSCEEYNFILRAITCFRDLNSSLPLQQDLSKIMSCHSTRHGDSKVMFLHFYGLMSLSFASGFDCLVKGCLLAIMSALNLFVFEEGNLDALKIMVESHSESFSTSSPVVGIQEAVVGQNSAFVVASRFQKKRALHLSMSENKCNEMETSHLEPGVDFEEETGEKSNGELFFKCMMKMGQKASYYDDVVDYVECKIPNEFSTWFDNRQRYRRSRLEKKAALRRKRKKKGWKTCEEKLTQTSK